VFGKRPKAVGIPTQVELDKLAVETITATPLPLEAKAKLLIPDSAWDKLCAAWTAGKGQKYTPTGERVGKTDGFLVWVELHEARAGFIVLFARWDGVKVLVGFSAYDDDDEIVTEITHDIAEELTPENRDFLENHVWKHVPPALTLVRSTRVAPNALCPCGSGKKFKKCCS
jgi:hypothetical protein